MQYNPSSDKTEKAAFYTIVMCGLGSAGGEVLQSGTFLRSGKDKLCTDCAQSLSRART